MRGQWGGGGLRAAVGYAQRFFDGASGWLKGGLLAFVVCGTAITSAALGATSPVDLGLGWLQGQLLGNGLLNTPSQVAADEQSSCETAKTLVKLAGLGPGVAALVNSLPTGTSSATQTVACQRYLQRAMGLAPAGVLGERYVAGAGFAAFPDHAVPSLLDTGWALQSELVNLTATERNMVLEWLRSQQHADGSFSQGKGASLVSTSNILLGLKDAVASSEVASAMAAKAVAYLLTSQDTTGSWASDIATTAMVFEAVQPYAGHSPTVAATVQSYLLSQQSLDGSWGADPYVSALALRALQAAGQIPDNPLQPGNQTRLVGVVTDRNTDFPLVSAAVSVNVMGKSVSVSTGAKGNFDFNVPSGVAAISVTAAGYKPISTALDLAPGTELVFSPALVPVADAGAPISGAKLSGTVVGFTDFAALRGVQITATRLNGPAAAVPATTNDLGAFALNLPAGTYSVVFQSPGYQTQTLLVALLDGAKTVLGSVVMRPQRQTSSLRGTVADSAGMAIAGARISATVNGTELSTTSGTNGAYILTGLASGAVQISVSAENYRTVGISISVAQPADLVRNIVLPGAGGAGPQATWTLSDLVVTPASAGARLPVLAQVKVANSAAVAASAQARLLVTRPDGTTIANVGATDTQGEAIGVFPLAAGQSKTLRFPWNTATFPAGAYGVTIQLFEPGSVATQTPQGVVLNALTSVGAIQITADPHFSGSLVATPPVLQLGMGTTVQLAATLQNSGNVPLASQVYQLDVLDAAGNTVQSQTAVGAWAGLSQLINLGFADWTPSVAGNFTLRIRAQGIPGSEVTQTVHVGDYGVGQFKVSKTVVPAGTQTVRGTINTKGIDITTGSITDPLVPLVKQAITKAVNYADNFASGHYVNDLRCYACHVQTQSIVGGERNLATAPPLNPLKRTTLLNGILQAVEQGGGITDMGVYYQNVNTGLGLWATTEWHESQAVTASNTRMAQFLLNNQLSSGAWYPDHPASWWATYAPLTALNLGSLSTLKSTLAVPGVEVKWPELTHLPVASLPGGHMRFAHAGDGSLYVANLSSQQLWHIAADGSASMLESSFPIRNVQILSDGRLLLATLSGIYIRDAAGVKVAISTEPAEDARAYTNGNYLMTKYYGGGVYLLNDQGQTSVFAESDLLGAAAGAMHVLADGSILVADVTAQKILHLDAQGQLIQTPVPLANGNPINILPYQDGYLVSTTAGLFRYDKNWVVERWTFTGALGVALMPDGRLLVNDLNSIYELQKNPVDTAGLTSRIDTAVSATTAWLVSGTEIDPNNNIDVAFRLIGLGNARKHYQGTARETEFVSLMQNVGATLRARQRADGGWVWKEGAGYTTSDSMVTAMVGIALDNLNPSPRSPEVRNAVTLLLSRQQPNGAWISENGISTAEGALIPSTWVEIWLPVMLDRLGGLDTQVALALPANITFTNPDLAPTRTEALPDGGARYTWDLVGVPEAGRQINFDLTLHGMAVGEVRAAASEASLTFANSFTQGTVTAPMAIPDVMVDPQLHITVATDKPLYQQSELAQLRATVHNAGNLARDALVRLTVLDAAGEVTTAFAPANVAAIAPGASGQATAPWATAAVLAGGYQVRAELVTAQGVAYGSAVASFTVQAGAASGGDSLNSTRVSTDRSRYSAAQTVRIDARAANLSANLLQENLQLVTQVTGPDGKIVLTRTEAIAQAAPGSQHPYSYSLPAAVLAPGVYQVRLQLLGSALYLPAASAVQAASMQASSVELSASSTSFTVQDTQASGVGLHGQIQATPATVRVGESTTLQLQVTNDGNASISNATVRARVLDPVTGDVLAVYTQPGVQLAQGATTTFNWPWTSKGKDGDILPVAATIDLTGTEQALAQTTVTLTAETDAPVPLPVPMNHLWLLTLLLPAIALTARRAKPRTATPKA